MVGTCQILSLSSVRDMWTVINRLPHHTVDVLLTQVFKSGRSDSQADLLSNTANIDRTPPGHTVSTVMALSNSLRRRTDKTSSKKTIGDNRPNGNAIDLTLVTGYHTNHSECLQQEADLYSTAINGQSNMAFVDVDSDVPPVTRRPESGGASVGPVAFAYDNPFCTTEV
jgi:hypothetical protein